MNEAKRRNPLSFLFPKQRRHSIPRKTMQDTHIPTGIFGVPLEHAAECGSVTPTGLFVPDPVHRCMNEVIRRGLSVEGIFRLSGAASDVDQLYQQFDTPPAYGKFIDLATHDIHAIVGVMKKYLRCLPDPVIPITFHPQFLQAATDMERIASLAAQMPRAHFDLLFTLIELCSHIQRHQDDNLMNPEALSVVLAPVCTGLDHSLRDLLIIKNPAHITDIVHANQRWTELWKAMIEGHDTLLTLWSPLLTVPSNSSATTLIPPPAVVAAAAHHPKKNDVIVMRRRCHHPPSWPVDHWTYSPIDADYLALQASVRRRARSMINPRIEPL